MKKIWIIGLILCTQSLLAESAPKIFFDGTFLEIQKKAKEEGKYQLLQFVAKWCLPCKHMDQTTFQNPELQSYMSSHFVSAKIDIDDFDGFALKQEYGVRFLPTIIVLDHEGNVLGKYEEAMGPTKLKNVLMDIQQEHPITAERTSRTSVAPNPPEETVERTDQHKPEKTVFITDKTILQFGVFGSLSNAESLYEKVANYLPSYPEVKTIELSSGKSAYAVQYGPFKEIEEAEMIQEELSILGFDSIIKKLQ